VKRASQDKKSNDTACSVRTRTSRSATDTEERWERVKAALTAVLEQSPANRAKFLERVCGHDPSLLDEVRSLVEAYDDDYLEHPVAPASLAAPAKRADEPRTIGPYTVVERIGAGGMGVVYKVVDAAGHSFALKRLIEELVTEEGLLRLRREASAASALDHPNIVRFETLIEDEGVPHLVMEYLEGQTLKRLLAGGHRLELDDALHIAFQVAEALDCAHARGIVHRDLKPGNILVTRSARVKLLDFGIAKLIAAASGVGATLEKRLTKSGEVLGTKGYMAPEQARGETVDARADVFSFGCVLYEILCGKSAFSGGNALGRSVAILSEEPPRLKERVPSSVPRELDELVHRSLMKDPGGRPSSMKEVLEVLHHVRTSD